MTDFTSVSLLDRVKSDVDSRAWSDFAQLYETIIRGWLAQQGISAQDSDDVVQEVMTYVCQEIPKFEHNGRPGAFRNWLRRITAFRLQLFWRSRKQATTAGLDLDHIAEQLADEQSNVSATWQLEHDRYVLQHLLSQLAAQFQAKSLLIFRRVVLEEQPAQQVAEDLDMSLGAVRVAQSRVLQALKELGKGWID